MHAIAVAPSGLSVTLPPPEAVPGVLVAGDWNVFDLVEGDWHGEAGDWALKGSPSVTDTWALLPEPVESGMRVRVCDVRGRRERAVVDLEGVRKVHSRLQGEHAVIADTAGRVLVISLKDGRVIREARVG
jgi:hypothetical protein